MATKLGDGVWQLHCRGVNAYLLDDGDLTLVDAGGPWDAPRIRNEVRDAGYRVADLDRVLLTHYDVDHVGGLGRLEGFDAPVYLGDPDRAYLIGERDPRLVTRKEAIQRIATLLVEPPNLPVRSVEDGDEFGSVVARSAPGHTSGHTVYVSRDLSAALLGDAVRSSRGRLREVPWVLSRDRRRGQDTIRRLAETLPPVEIVGPGHGDPLPRGGGDALADLAARL